MGARGRAASKKAPPDSCPCSAPRWCLAAKSTHAGHEWHTTAAPRRGSGCSHDAMRAEPAPPGVAPWLHQAHCYTGALPQARGGGGARVAHSIISYHMAPAARTRPRRQRGRPARGGASAAAAGSAAPLSRRRAARRAWQLLKSSKDGSCCCCCRNRPRSPTRPQLIAAIVCIAPSCASSCASLCACRRTNRLSAGRQPIYAG